MIAALTIVAPSAVVAKVSGVVPMFRSVNVAPFGIVKITEPVAILVVLVVPPI